MAGSEEAARMAGENERFHRYTILVAISALILIAIGAYITSLATGPQPASRGQITANFHRFVAVAVCILALDLAVWQSQSSEGYSFGWTAFGFFAATAWAGWLGLPLLHASLAPLAFAMLVAMVVVTSRAWNNAPELVDDAAAPWLRRLALAAPPLVFLQSVLGAAYRHNLTGVIPHLAGAMIVLLAILIAATQVLQRFPKPQALRSAAIWMMSILLAQVTLGVTAFAMKLLDVRSTAALVISTASHVVVGSLTLAACLVFAMRVQRHVRCCDAPLKIAEPNPGVS